MTNTGININNENKIFGQNNTMVQDTKREQTGITSGNIDSVLGYKYEKDNNSTKSAAVADGFEEYMKQQQEKAKEKGIDEETREREQKKAEKEIANTLTEEEIRQLTRMGIDVESATLSDLMGMVNTLRGEEKRRESAELMAKITMSKGELDGMFVTGGEVKQAGSGIELDGIDVAEVVLEKNTTELFEITKEDIVYLLKNEEQPDKETLYKAHYSGLKLAEKNDGTLYASMEQQLDKVIMQAGLNINDDTKEVARLLFDNDLCVTTDNLRKYMDYKKYIGLSVEDIELPKEVESNAEAARKLFETVARIDSNAAYEMTLKGIDITLASTLTFCESGYDEERALKYAKELTAEKSFEAVSNMRKLEEIRLSMTLEAAGRLVNTDINIDTRELSTVVSKLREIENEMIAKTLSGNGIAATPENISVISNLSQEVKALADKPASIIGLPLKGISFTVRQLSAASEDNTQELKGTDFEKVKRSYEAVGTSVRYDMGDSIAKAFGNVDDILAEMNLEINYENQRAVRILGYNQIEITRQSVDDIVNYDRQINELIENFYPEAVLGLIKDKINPLDVSIEELNNTIRSKKYNAGVSEAKNFATFLRDMEAMGEVDAAERESYIGMYRVMEKLAKSGDREAGWIYNNGGMLTIRNVITAMRSKKAAGIDIGIDDDFGMLEEQVIKGKKMDVQIESAFSVSEETKRAIDDRAVSQFAEEMNIEMSMLNANAMYTILYETGGIYQLASEILNKMNFKTDTADEEIDEAAENIKESLLGDAPDIEMIPENILESLTGSEEMSLKYEDLRDKMIEAMYQAASAGIISSKDISAIKTVAAGFNIMSHMAGNDRYQLPYRTNDGVGVMNLVINHDRDKRGTIEIDFKSEREVRITAGLFLSEDGELFGSLVADESEENERLQVLSEGIKEQIQAEGYNADNITFGEINRKNVEVGIVGGEGQKLYKAAVDLVKVFSKI